jgi:peptide/nickel transport system ATP-binding protein
MIFQEPMTSLNPVYTAGEQVIEAMLAHEGEGRVGGFGETDRSEDAARDRVITLFRDMGIPDAERRFDAYPHQLSGGMRQRVMIAMALSCEPDLLVADEPTTALDVTIQAQILSLLRRRQRERGLAVLLITHDLGVVAQVCDRVVVMYAGRVVESGPTDQVLVSPAHPYTRGLLRALPGNASARVGARAGRLEAIEGSVPSLLNVGPGCRFANRCGSRSPACEADPPVVLLSVADERRRAGHSASCHHIETVPESGC